MADTAFISEVNFSVFHWKLRTQQRKRIDLLKTKHVYIGISNLLVKHAKGRIGLEEPGIDSAEMACVWRLSEVGDTVSGVY